MSRFPDRHESVQELLPLGRMPLSQGRGPAGADDEQRSPEESRAGRLRLRTRALDRTFEVSRDERALLRTVGQFRTLEQTDVVKVLYGGNQGRYDSDRLNLARHGLLERRTVLTRQRGRIDVLVLSERGRRFLEAGRESADAQMYFAGLAKPREVVHDASIYRMYEEQKSAIEGAGGRVRRVVLDYELKRELYGRTAGGQGRPKQEADQIRDAAAAEVGLRVVDGKVPLPDLRIEYEAADGTMARVDLEAVTGHYHRQHLAEKRAAGFRLWGADESGRKSAVRDDHDLMGDIFDL
jgi:hypothetical protein